MSTFGPVIRVPSKQTSQIVNKFDCDAGLSVGDLVIPSLTTGNKVETLTSNIYNGLCIGVVIEKPSATVCSVITVGPLLGQFTGLATGKPLFVGLLGVITTTVPATGGLQILGYAMNTTDVFLNVNFNKTVRS